LALGDAILVTLDGGPANQSWWQSHRTKSYYIADGGLVSYEPNTHDPVRRAAGYVDRILKGEKPADMPVQAPTKYELIVNLKTAKTLGLAIPQSLLATPDEVIE
jgi:ABC-type uncharacterized transport system substrate-binding protein